MVSILGACAFDTCSALQSIRLPSSLETISPSCFGFCDKSDKKWIEVLGHLKRQMFQ
jgi:hypothetical protein